MKSAIFKPKDDITALELAKFISTFEVRLREEQVRALPDSVRRHIEFGEHVHQPFGEVIIDRNLPTPD